jgi:hypothetical protein
MRKFTVFNGLSSLETLDLRLSPTSLSLGAHLAPPVVSHHDSTLEDLLPDPELATAADPINPSTPTSGPSGPGSS